MQNHVNTNFRLYKVTNDFPPLGKTETGKGDAKDTSFEDRSNNAFTYKGQSGFNTQLGHHEGNITQGKRTAEGSDSQMSATAPARIVFVDTIEKLRDKNRKHMDTLTETLEDRIDTN